MNAWAALLVRCHSLVLAVVRLVPCLEMLIIVWAGQFSRAGFLGRCLGGIVIDGFVCTISGVQLAAEVSEPKFPRRAPKWRGTCQNTTASSGSCALPRPARISSDTIHNVQERVSMYRPAIYVPQVLTTISFSPGAKSKVKSSVQRTIRAKVLETYPLLEPYIEDILPKKEQLDLVKLYVPT